MCSCDEPAIYSDKARLARKTHWCVECRRDRIRPGDIYHEHRGLWDCRWDCFRVCARCTAARKAMVRETPADACWCWSFGDLRESLQERSSWRRRSWRPVFSRRKVAAGSRVEGGTSQ